jgi:hypothetical protein
MGVMRGMGLALEGLPQKLSGRARLAQIARRGVR